MGVEILSLKTATVTAGVLLSAAALFLLSPAVTGFLVAEAPRFYESLSTWLSPPYLHVIVNGIIISIAATSRFQKPVAGVFCSGDPATAGDNSNAENGGNSSPEFFTPAICTEAGLFVSEDVAGDGRATAKQPDSARFGGGRSLKTSAYERKTRSKKNETLESTWRMITDVRHVPLGRHLRKSDTWETHPPFTIIQKSETFAASSIPTTVLLPPSRSAASSPSVGKLKRDPSAGKLPREPSIGQDDLNRRVEAFIKKFNAEMRLQRQNPLHGYMDMFSCSSH